MTAMALLCYRYEVLRQSYAKPVFDRHNGGIVNRLVTSDPVKLSSHRNILLSGQAPALIRKPPMCVVGA